MWYIYFHISHVLQLFYLNQFLTIEDQKYHSHVSHLARFSDSTPVNKTTIVKNYNLAFQEAFSKHTMSRGGNAAGSVLWNLENGINSFQVCSTTTSAQPSWETIKFSLSTHIFSTSKPPADIWGYAVSTPLELAMPTSRHLMLLWPSFKVDWEGTLKSSRQ